MGIERRANGRWGASVVVGDRRIRIGSFGAEEEAREALAIEYGRLQAGTSVLLKTGAAIDIRTFASELHVRLGTVRRWVHEGMPILHVGTGTAHRVERAVALAWVKEHHRDSVAFSRDALVYAVQRKRDAAIKLGWTSSLARRLHEIGRDTRSEVKLLAAIPGDKPAELRLHARFKAHHIEGEWYQPADEILSWIESLGAAA